MKHIYIENPDKETLKEVREAIAANDDYCCCAIAKTPDTKCMCKEFRERESAGLCHCGRYVKIPVYPSLVIVSNIEDKELAAYYYDTLILQGLNVTLAPNLNITNENAAVLHFMELAEMTKSAIYGNDGIFVISDKDKLDAYAADLVEWAQILNKKIIYLGDEI